MRTARVLLDSSLVRIAEVRCAGDPHGWSSEEPVSLAAVVLVRRGVFRRRLQGVERFIDAAAAYIQVPATVQQVDHPCGGDLCTVLAPGAQLLDESLDPTALTFDLLYPSPASVAEHRLLLARARAGANDFELTERAALLLGNLLAEASDSHARRRARDAGVRRKVERARELVAYDPDITAQELARAVGFPIYGLCRAFRAITGLTLTSYRSQLRIQRALELLGERRHGLAALAAECGFSDQSHLTRVLRKETGMTPALWRATIGERQH
jgi:AraC-like DNA-binding protein